ncbi:hypothetical protein JG687_00012354 [Phytophthora cactorum]|uniref:Uncharacterized protein n=1 Tax=Phytophthora cactorum TaxID=29920 RepID=A0A8T1U251_9STRA|nr:hypothetical protein JG687_00012354 [Phytophthora cactorum]
MAPRMFQLHIRSSLNKLRDADTSITYGPIKVLKLEAGESITIQTGAALASRDRSGKVFVVPAESSKINLFIDNECPFWGSYNMGRDYFGSSRGSSGSTCRGSGRGSSRGSSGSACRGSSRETSGSTCRGSSGSACRGSGRETSRDSGQNS